MALAPPRTLTPVPPLPEGEAYVWPFSLWEKVRMRDVMIVASP
jgi:hypothetical protein